MKKLIDLNADAGESFGRWRLGHDEKLLPLVSSVNVACGWHAGDPATMRRSVALAQSGKTALGAHPGLPDLTGFGRRAMALSPQEAADACMYQYGALRAFAEGARVTVQHVKAHGALYGLTLRDPDVANAIAAAPAAHDRTRVGHGVGGTDAAATRGGRGGGRGAREPHPHAAAPANPPLPLPPHLPPPPPGVGAPEALPGGLPARGRPRF